MVILEGLNSGNRIWNYKVQGICRYLTEKKLLISTLVGTKQKRNKLILSKLVRRMFQKSSLVITVIERL